MDSTLEEIKFEALWCLTNVASSNSDHVNSIVIKDGIPKILNFVESEVVEIQSQVKTQTIIKFIRPFGVSEISQETPLKTVTKFSQPKDLQKF